MACPRPEAESVLERCGVFFSVLFCFGGVGVTGCFGRQPVISHLGARCFQKFMLSLPWGSAYIFLSQSHTATPSLFFSGYQFLADNEALQDSPSTSCFPGSLVSQPKHPTRVLGTELLLARVHGGIWRPCRHHLGRKTEKEKKSFKALLRLICRQVRFCCVFVIWPCAERRRGLPASPVSAADPDAIPSCPLPLLVKCTRSLAASEQGCPSSNQGSSFLKFLLLQYLGGNDTNNSKS